MVLNLLTWIVGNLVCFRVGFTDNLTAESPAVLVKKSVISWADADDLKCDLETCIFNKHST